MGCKPADDGDIRLHVFNLDVPIHRRSRLSLDGDIRRLWQRANEGEGSTASNYIVLRVQQICDRKSFDGRTFSRRNRVSDCADPYFHGLVG